MFKRLHSSISRSQDWYNTSRGKIKLTTNIKIKNKLLSEELEQECKKRNGILTYAEYLKVDQFGKNGYYSKSKMHGKTDVETRWGRALAKYCELSGHDTIIEVGCGSGELGVAAAREYKKQTKKTLKWIGVEIDTKLHTTIFENFEAHKLKESVVRIVANLDELQSENNPLIVFPYSLDNMPPQVFLNTSSATSYPNTLLGISVDDGMLSEVIIPPETLQKKQLKLENGFFTQNKITYKLTGWKLKKGQRAYIPLDSFTTIYTYAKKCTRPSMILIDEFRNEPWFFNPGNLGIPKSLYEKNLLCNDRERYYRESGKHNLYYPIYKNSLPEFLHAIGFQSVEYEIEQKKAAELSGKPWFPIGRNYNTLCYIAKDFVDKKLKFLPVPFNPQRIV